MSEYSSSSSLPSSLSSQDIGIAFTITIIAGLATSIGGAVVFAPSMVNFNPTILSFGLAVGAGAVLYLAFVDLLPSSLEFLSSSSSSSVHNDDHGNNEDDIPDEQDLSLLWATLSFFGGIATLTVLSLLERWISPNSHDHDIVIKNCANDSVTNTTTSGGGTDDSIEREDPSFGTTHPVEDGDIEEDLRRNNATNGDASVVDGDNVVHNLESPELADTLSMSDKTVASDGSKKSHNTTFILGPSERKRLWQSGISTGVALFLHNLPEGIITYLAALDDPVVGSVLAIGILLHNIPEGAAVSLPIYYSTQKRWLAFGASVVTGLAQPIGALLAYWILASQNYSDITFGVMFGVASGMLVYVAAKNLLPTAHRYDPNDTVTTTGFILGMVVIAIALVVLASTGNHNHGAMSSMSSAAESSFATEEMTHAMHGVDIDNGDQHGHDDDHHRKRFL
jgi:ZIP family zinc transporter